MCGVSSKTDSAYEANPDNDPTKPKTPLPIFINVPVVKAVCGPSHILILTINGRIHAFGNNYDGQVGKGSFGYQKTPLLIDTSVVFKDIAAGDNHLSIAVSQDDH